MGLTAKTLDFIFFVYFLTHIPICIFVDSQAVLPKSLYPQQVQDLIAWYCREFRDPMMVDPPGWFKSFCLCEVTIQFPFFFVGTYAFWKGYQKCLWIRVPAITYASHVATTLVAILYHVLTYDFSQGVHPGPRNMDERLFLCSIYSPYFIVPVLILIRLLFGNEHLATKKKIR